MDYAVDPAAPDFSRYFDQANRLLTRHGLAPFRAADLDGQAKQLMALIDLLHLHGIAVIFDVVYNHAGGGFDDESMWFHDRQADGDNNRSLYFTDQGWAGGLVYAYWKAEVRQFLIDNAGFFFDEYHVDGFRFDEVTVIDSHGGWGFLQDLDGDASVPQARGDPHRRILGGSVLRASPRSDSGAGFDAVVAAGLAWRAASNAERSRRRTQCAR